MKNIIISKLSMLFFLIQATAAEFITIPVSSTNNTIFLPPGGVMEVVGGNAFLHAFRTDPTSGEIIGMLILGNVDRGDVLTGFRGFQVSPRTLNPASFITVKIMTVAEASNSETPDFDVVIEQSTNGSSWTPVATYGIKLSESPSRMFRARIVSRVP